jgi:hypothetical protein
MDENLAAAGSRCSARRGLPQAAQYCRTGLDFR